MTTASFKVGELQREIERRGLSQASLAFAAGLTPSTVFKACRGDQISPSSFGRIVRALGAIAPVNKQRVS